MLEKCETAESRMRLKDDSNEFDGTSETNPLSPDPDIKSNLRTELRSWGSSQDGKEEELL